MDLKVFRLKENRYLESAPIAEFVACHSEDGSFYWVDIAQPDPVALSEFLSPLLLHPLILEGCLDPETGSLIAPYERTLFIKLRMQLGLDDLNQPFLSIICLPNSIITIHESSFPALEGIAKDFSAAVRFHTLSTSAILYQILDRVIDEDMTYVLKARRQIESLEETIDDDLEDVQLDQVLTL